MREDILARIAKLEMKLAAARVFLASLDDELPKGGLPEISQESIDSLPLRDAVEASKLQQVMDHITLDTGYGSNIKIITAALPPHPEVFTLDDVMKRLTTPLMRDTVGQTLSAMGRRKTIEVVEAGRGRKQAKYKQKAA